MTQEKSNTTPSQDDSARGEQQQEIQNPQLLNSELAKAFQELARGEQTATALENRLDDIEGRIEQLLASVEQNAAQKAATRTEAEADPSPDTSKN